MKIQHQWKVGLATAILFVFCGIAMLFLLSTIKSEYIEFVILTHYYISPFSLLGFDLFQQDIFNWAGTIGVYFMLGLLEGLLIFSKIKGTYFRIIFLHGLSMFIITFFALSIAGFTLITIIGFVGL